MRLQSLKAALEELNENSGDFIADTEDTVEQEILALHAEMDAHADREEALVVVIDGIGQASEFTDGLVEAGTGTAETLALLSMMTAPYMATIKKPKIATEGYAGTITEQHVIAQESFKTDWQNAAQDAVVSFKQSKDFWSDLFRDTSEKITKYENILAEAEAEFNGKVNTHQEQYHHGSMHQLWYFFSTEKGQAVNVVQVMSRDFAVSEYILTTYPEQLVNLFKSLTSAVNGANLKDQRSIVAFAEALEKLKHPVDLFDRKWVGGRPYFGPMGLKEVSKTHRHAVSIGSKSFERLAELASAKHIEEEGSAWHTTKKVLASTTYPGAMVASFITKEITMTDEDVRKLIDFGKNYLKNVRKFLSLEQKVLGAAEEMTRAMAKLADKAGSLEGKDDHNARMITMQAQAIASNILTCLRSPGVQEVARALKAARYCGYLSKRMNWNSK